LGGQKRAFAELQAKAQKFGVSGLSAEEKQAYLQLLSSSSNKG
jgi:DNA primase